VFVNLKLFKMKRNENKVPEFDEIIFENRNKAYGAYVLRKKYKSATSISILGGIAFSIMLMMAISFTTEKGTASDGPKSVVIVISDPLIPEKIKVPEMKPPAALTDVARNLKPEVTEDTTQITTDIPTTDEIARTITDGDINDTVTFIEPSDPVIQPEEKIFIVVEESPEYPGGLPELMKFVNQNIVYPYEAQVNNIQGKVILKFVVNTDGSVDRIDLLRSIDPLLDNEAIRVVRSLPKFRPGKQGGVPVRVWFSLPVSFKIQDN
jgi:protein TonB